MDSVSNFSTRPLLLRIPWIKYPQKGGHKSNMELCVFSAIAHKGRGNERYFRRVRRICSCIWSSKFGIFNAISCTEQGGEQIWQKKNRLSLPSLQWTTRKEKIRIFSSLQRPLGFISCFISWSRKSRSFPSKCYTYHIISNQLKRKGDELTL